MTRLTADARSPHRGFTILEMVVVLVLLGLMTAFLYPKLSGNQNLARDQQAQTSASAALDAISTVAISLGSSSFTVERTLAPNEQLDGPECSTAGSPPQATPAGWSGPARLIMDGAPYPVQALSMAPDPATYAPTYATSCPLFANPITLASTTGDVHFNPGDIASGTDPATGTVTAASRAAALSTTSVAAANTGLAWRVGVAVLSPQGGSGATKATVSTCWMAWREYPLGGVGGGSARERYFYVTNLTDDATGCTGAAALSHGVPPTGTPGYKALTDSKPAPGDPAWKVLPWSDLACETPAFVNRVDRLGVSWRSPCGDYDPSP